MAGKETISSPEVDTIVKPRRRINKRVIVVVLALVLFGAGAGGYYIWSSQQKKAVRNLCVEQPLDALNPVNYQKLQPYVDNIKARKGFEKDANCLGVVVAYYVGVSDVNDAQKYLSDLEKVYKPDVGYDQQINPYLRPPERIKPALEFISKQREQVKKNSFRGPLVEQ